MAELSGGADQAVLRASLGQPTAPTLGYCGTSSGRGVGWPGVGRCAAGPTAPGGEGNPSAADRHFQVWEFRLVIWPGPSGRCAGSIRTMWMRPSKESRPDAVVTSGLSADTTPCVARPCRGGGYERTGPNSVRTGLMGAGMTRCLLRVRSGCQCVEPVLRPGGTADHRRRARGRHGCRGGRRGGCRGGCRGHDAVGRKLGG